MYYMYTLHIPHKNDACILLTPYSQILAVNVTHTDMCRTRIVKCLLSYTHPDIDAIYHPTCKCNLHFGNLCAVCML